MRNLSGSSQGLLARLGLRRKNSRREASALATHGRRLRLEPLEDRRVLAVMTVTALGDGPAAGNADGFLSLREAIHALNVGAAVDGIGPTSGSFGVDDRVVFAPSVVGTIQLLAGQGELLIENEMVIEGPGAGLLTVRAADPSGELGDGHRVIRVAHPAFGTNDGVEIVGLTITGGDTPDSGGGILTSVDLIVRNAVITENVAYFFAGGGIAAVDEAELTIVESDIVDNYAAIAGGVYASGDSLLISHSRIRDNGAYANGAGIGVLSLSPTGLPQTSVVVEYSQVINNQLDDLLDDPNQAHGGGGVHIETSATLDIHFSEVSGSASGHFSVASAQEGTRGTGQGGGIYSSALEGTFISHSLISDNTSKGEGGGAFLSLSPNSRVWNTTISGNKAVQGGGLIISDAQVLHCTVTNNDAGDFNYPDFLVGDVVSAGGGGILIYRASSFMIDVWIIDVFEATINHTIITGNTHAVGIQGGAEVFTLANNGVSPDIGVTTPIGIIAAIDRPNFENPLSVSYSLIGSTLGPLSGGDNEDPRAVVQLSGPGNLVDVIAGLGDLQDNGGVTLPDGSVIRTHALLPTSPAVDAGDPLFTAPPEFDQRGTPFDRIYDWPGVGPEGLPRIDIGAFELQPAPAPDGDADFNDDEYVDGADFLIWQRGFGAINATPAQGDADDDADVDGDDLAVWKETFGTVVPIPVVPTQIAAPQSVIQDPPPLQGREQPSMVASGNHAQGGSPREAIRGGIPDRRHNATAETSTFNPYLTGENLSPNRSPQGSGRVKPASSIAPVIDQPAIDASKRLSSFDPSKPATSFPSRAIGKQTPANNQELFWQDLDEVFSRFSRM